MSQKNTLLIVFLLLLVIAVIIGASTYLLYWEILTESESQGGPTPNGGEQVAPERYKGTLKGVINYSFSARFEREVAVIKVDGEKEYILWPMRPRSYYEEIGIEEGQEVKVKGEVISGDRFYVESIQ